MKVGLIDVDSHNFPNLALMKISAWEKAQGNSVEWLNLFENYGRVYQAKIFDNTYSKDFEYEPMTNELIRGGTGYGIGPDLPDEIEHIYPDYSIYDIKNNAIGFITRGCPRGCKFCIVGEKEGLKTRRVADLWEFWDGQKNITLLDPNLTASADCVDIMKDLAKTKAWVDFNQGIDIRFMTDEKAQLLNEIKIKMIHFAWDNYEFRTYEKLKEFRTKLNYDVRRLRVYVLTNFNTTHEQDLERIYKLKELEYDPYVMIYDKPHAPRETRLLARWVNNKFVFRSCNTFEEYDSRRA